MMDKMIRVTMFHTFSITYLDHSINGDSMKSEKLVRLFAYLLSNNLRAIPSSELMDALWYYDEVDNPVGALKNLVYRLRSLLKKEFGLSDLIVTGKGTYSMNQAYQYEIDTELFEKVNNDILSQSSKNLDDYERCMNLYTGKYLTEIVDDYNILSKSAYYHSLYIDRVIEYANLLEENHEYAKMEQVAYKAIEMDQLEESLYEILIKALYYQKEYKKAMDTYKSTVELLYKSLGVRVSSDMEEIYELIKKESHSEDSTIQDIYYSLDGMENEGAFLCEYGTFKEMYNMQVRMIGRLGTCAHFCLITVASSHSQKDDKEKKLIDRTMDKIQEALVCGLRMGDVISKFSVNQYVVLLPTCNYENALSAMDRVLRKVRYSLNHTYVSINIAIEEVHAKER